MHLPGNSFTYLNIKTFETTTIKAVNPFENNRFYKRHPMTQIQVFENNIYLKINKRIEIIDIITNTFQQKEDVNYKNDRQVAEIIPEITEEQKEFYSRREYFFV